MKSRLRIAMQHYSESTGQVEKPAKTVKIGENRQPSFCGASTQSFGPRGSCQVSRMRTFLVCLLVIGCSGGPPQAPHSPRSGGAFGQRPAQKTTVVRNLTDSRKGSRAAKSAQAQRMLELQASGLPLRKARKVIRNDPTECLRPNFYLATSVERTH